MGTIRTGQPSLTPNVNADPPPPPDDAAANGAPQRPVAKRGTVEAKSSEKGAPKGEVKGGGRGQSIEAMIAAAKDTLTKGEGKELLLALTTLQLDGAAQDPKQGNADALAAMQALKELLGKPTGARVAEAFEHPDVTGHAAVPVALSSEALASIVELATAPGAIEKAPETLRTLVANVTVATHPELEEASARTKAIAATYAKLQLFSEKLVQRYADPLPQPGTPNALKKLLDANFPQIAAAMKQIVNGMGPLPKSTEKRVLAGEVVIPEPHVHALEKAFEPVFAGVRLMTNQLQAVAKQPMEAAKLNDLLAGMTQAHPTMHAVAQDWTIAQAKPQWAIAWSPQWAKSGGGGAGSVTSKGAQGGGSGIFGGGGIDMLTADLEACMIFTMMQGVQSESDIMRDAMDEMQRTMKEKQAMRAKITKMKSEQADLNVALQKEFDYLKGQGALADTVTLEDYKAWRQVTWTEEGDALLQQPIPDLPDTLVYGQSGPVEDPGPPTGDPEFPCDPALAEKYAKIYGVSPHDIAYLYSYYAFCMKNGSAALGLTAEQFAKKFGDPLHGFNYLLQQQVGLPRITVVWGEKDHVSGDPAQNSASIDSFFENTVAADTGLVPAEAAEESSGTDESGDLPWGQQPVTDRAMYNFSKMDTSRVLDLFMDTIKEEPFKSAIEKVFGGELPSRDVLKALFNQAQQPSTIGNPARDLLRQIAAAMYKAGGDAEPACKGYAAFLVLRDRYNIQGKTGGPDGKTLNDIAGGAAQFFWESGSDPATGADFDRYRSDAANSATGVASDIWNLLMQEPYCSDPTIRDLFSQIEQYEDEDSWRESFIDFLSDGDASFDDVLGKVMANLVNRVMALAGGDGRVPKVAAMLLAIQAEDGSGEERENGQEIFWDDQTTRDRMLASYPDPVVPPKDEAVTDDTSDDTSADDASGGTPGDPAGGIAGGRGETRAQADAAEAGKRAAAAAADAIGGLRGKGLEGEKGAQTGTFEQLGVAIQSLQDKMDSMSELSEMQSMRLQLIMDRRAKMLETLSNAMKKMSETKKTVGDNIK